MTNKKIKVKQPSLFEKVAPKKSARKPINQVSKEGYDKFLNESPLEAALENDLRLFGKGLPAWEREYHFHDTRKWRFDFAWPGAHVAAEVEGGVWNSGRHTRGLGFQSDCEKYNAASLLGWRVLRFTESMIKSGDALNTIKAALCDQTDEKQHLSLDSLLKSVIQERKP
jgi:hypothetical protein